MRERYEEPYRDRGYRRDDRGFVERAGDEVRSWFGDEEAERRRQYDEQRDRGRFRERQYGQSSDYSGRYDRSHDGSSSYPTGEQDWNRSHGSGASYGPGYNPNYTYGYGQSQRYGSGFDVRDDYRSDWRRDLGGYSGEARGGFAGRGPKGYQRSDERIREDVCDRLCENPDIDASDIEVSVKQGEVTVSGSVSDRGEKRRAEDLIEQVSGVREVCNNLRVARGQDATISGTGSLASGSSGHAAGGAAVSNPGITGGGPSGATNVSSVGGRR